MMRSYFVALNSVEVKVSTSVLLLLGNSDMLGKAQWSCGWREMVCLKYKFRDGRNEFSSQFLILM